MGKWAEHSVEERGGRVTVFLTGPMVVSGVGEVDPQLRDFEGSVQVIDIADVSRMDTVGAWIVHRFAEEHDAEVIGASETAEVLLEAVADCHSTADISPPRPFLLSHVAEACRHEGIRTVRWHYAKASDFLAQFCCR